jgi:hypothetical protein
MQEDLNANILSAHSNLIVIYLCYTDMRHLMMGTCSEKCIIK